MTHSDLDVLVPQARVLELAGQRLTISPLVVGELPAMLKAVRPFAEQLTGEPDWLALLCDHGDALLAALALASRQPRDWVDALALDDGVERQFLAVAGEPQVGRRQRADRLVEGDRQPLERRGAQVGDVGKRRDGAGARHAWW
jgi:hypothetical protein